MDDTVHIAICFDRHMELPFLVLANSIKRHLKGGRRVVVHAFHCDPLAHDAAFYRGLDAGPFTVRLRQVENPYGGFPSGHLTAAIYMRLMLPTLLEDVDRLIYLDTDAVVVADIAPLYDTDLQGCPLAAVLDYPLLVLHHKNGWPVGEGPGALPVEQYMARVVRLSDWKSYFNTGVLVMDLGLFRKNALVDAAIRFLEKSVPPPVFFDQDALNHAIDGSFVPLDPRWNVTACRITGDFATPHAALDGAARLWKSDPWIIHFSGAVKPWLPYGPGTHLDKYFWREAAECEALPLLVEDYLNHCGQEGATRLQPPGSLLASGKPGLDREALLAHARKFAASPVVSAAGYRIAARLEQYDAAPDPRPALVPVELFSHRGGVPGDEALLFDLATAEGHIVYGPYRWYPPGNYDARFEISLSGIGAGGSAAGPGRLVLEIADDSAHTLALQELHVAAMGRPSPSTFTLPFTATGMESSLEFRIFAGGFTAGTLRFAGVTLSYRPAAAFTSAIAQL